MSWPSHRRPCTTPSGSGRWPAAIGVLAFGWVELVAANGDQPSLLAILAIAYVLTMFLGMSLFGVDAWCDRADPFGVYFSLFARISPITVDARLPRAETTPLRPHGDPWLPGTVAVICVAIGVTAFDGLSEGGPWNSIGTSLQRTFADLGFGLGHAQQIAFTIGLVAMILIVAGFYRLGVQGMHLEARDRSAAELSARFAHSLIPIALAYVVAHYFSLLLFQGQAIELPRIRPARRRQRPVRDRRQRHRLQPRRRRARSPTPRWPCSSIGHVAGLAVAHDRALVEFGNTEKAVRSQYWMLAVMIGFTTLGLWLLFEANR